MDFINTLMPNFERLSGELYECIGQTFTMLAVSGSIAWVLGVAVGVLLTVCRPGGILENRWLFTIFDRGIDIIRSIPFIILIVLLIPVSRFLVGTGSGVTKDPVTPEPVPFPGRHGLGCDGVLRRSCGRHRAVLCPSDRIGSGRH